MRDVVVLGNALIGDALVMWKHFLPQPDRRIEALCIPYNMEVPQAFRDLTTLQVDDIHVDCMENTPFMDMRGYEQWWRTNLRAWVTPADDVIMFFPNHSFEPLPVHTRYAPEGYITLQLDSFHPWKRWDTLLVTPFPLPTKTFQQAAVPGSCVGEPVLDKPLTDVGNIILRANAHVGINSSLTVFAGLLGIPTVMCCWEGYYMDFTNIPNTMRILCRPTSEEILQALQEVMR